MIVNLENLGKLILLFRSSNNCILKNSIFHERLDKYWQIIIPSEVEECVCVSAIRRKKKEWVLSSVAPISLPSPARPLRGNQHTLQLHRPLLLLISLEVLPQTPGPGLRAMSCPGLTGISKTHSNDFSM